LIDNQEGSEVPSAHVPRPGGRTLVRPHPGPIPAAPALRIVRGRLLAQFHSWQHYAPPGRPPRRV